jgi:hypothetical protein
VNVVLAVGSAVMMGMAASAIYRLQGWLEHIDYLRHFED